MKRLVLILTVALIPAMLMAQPQRRIQEAQQQAADSKSPTAVTLSPRARAQYTAQTSMPTEVTWRRDIYRELDLNKEKNAALYYPEEPLGDRVNFFTLILNLVLDGKVKAYEYRLDGNELFTPDNELDIENMLKKFYIDYEKKSNRYSVVQSTIPSRDIEKYYIKETHYLDQLSNYHTKVAAICPVLMQSDFGDAKTAYPMFWLDYDEVSPYLGQTLVMTSSFNNTTNMSLDDYFVMNRYEGEIYKTSNLRNQPLSDYCPTDSALQAERARIEKQLSDFRKGLWNEKEEPAAQASAKENGKAAGETAPKQQARKEKAEKEPRQKAPKAERQPRPQNTERISVRR